MLCFKFGMFQLNIYNAQRSKIFTPYLEMPPKQIVFQKLCPHRTLPQQILHDLSPNSSMLCFDMFGLNLHSALLQDFHSVIGNAPKEFVSQAVHTEHCPRKHCTRRHQIPVCCAFICSNWKSILLFSKTFTSCLKMPHGNFIKAFQMYISQLAIARMKSKTLS